MPWEEKKNHLYWAGASIDGYYQDSKWKNTQRVRFVKNMNKASLPVSLMRRDERSGRCKAHNDSMRSLSKYADVKFTFQDICSENICEEMRDPEDSVVWKGKEPPTEPYAKRFLMDVDGHTFTERFRRLLSSRNSVFKMIIFQEWHNDFLEPWVHYVPITLGMKELPETLRFLAETPEGQVNAKEIAEADRLWVGKAWRVVDMRVATFRILLESARLYGEDRDQTGECPWDRKGGGKS